MVKYIIEVDDKSKSGKGLLEIAKELSKTDKSVGVVNEDQGDKIFLEKMILARKKGLLNQEEKENLLKSEKICRIVKNSK